MSVHEPDFARFTELARGARLVPVFRRLLSDTLTPVSAFAKLDDGTSSGCLFESVVGGERVGRYSFLTAAPFLEIEAYDRRVVVREGGRVEEFTADNPLDELRRKVEAYPAAHLPELPPFVSGAVGYAGYDTVRYVERLPHAPADDRHVPDMAFAFYDHMVIFDNVNKTLIVVAMARLDAAGDLRAAYDDAARRVDELVARLHSPGAPLVEADIAVSGAPQIAYESNFTRAGFEAAVRKCVEYIRAGDIFQVVLGQRLKLEIHSPPFEIYRTLRVVNPSPFMFYLRTPGVTLVGSSPEVMVRVWDGVVTVRPLAGTRPRGADPEEDRRLADELLADAKERAEHVMLVDLGRNDVGRVAQFGSVRLSDVMTIERYSHVMHISSNVDGRLRPELSAFDALAACLPAGTVSGAPKVRAMEIIDELEPHRRGPYAGAVGYFDFCGNMDTCIALRTLVIQDHTAYVQVSAGIVADSDPAAEYQETLNKAKALLRSIEITEARAG
ncbi:MAG: anthranilate synthase component I [Pirellulales bacterium]|nr:anthranilate synthase component I [Pirellulales bacterium]